MNTYEQAAPMISFLGLCVTQLISPPKLAAKEEPAPAEATHSTSSYCQKRTAGAVANSALQSQKADKLYRDAFREGMTYRELGIAAGKSKQAAYYWLKRNAMQIKGERHTRESTWTLKGATA